MKPVYLSLVLLALCVIVCHAGPPKDKKNGKKPDDDSSSEEDTTVRKKRSLSPMIHPRIERSLSSKNEANRDFISSVKGGKKQKMRELLCGDVEKDPEQGETDADNEIEETPRQKARKRFCQQSGKNKKDSEELEEVIDEEILEEEVSEKNDTSVEDEVAEEGASVVEDEEEEEEEVVVDEDEQEDTSFRKKRNISPISFLYLERAVSSKNARSNTDYISSVKGKPGPP